MTGLTGSGWLLGRWLLYFDDRSLVVEQQAAPSCRECSGKGAWYEADGYGSEDGCWGLCPCTARLRRLVIPLGRRRPTQYSDEPPF
ncbi:hypothetical protein [Streptomyces spiramyceticus]|uniref:hypothetical protein n=1 Tax=Streptomyces spiramyceticus TaxID=299717 RepID=UPI00237A9478|nr:hypothetical protein [Streptomyces spiramyceticus]